MLIRRPRIPAIVSLGPHIPMFHTYPCCDHEVVVHQQFAQPSQPHVDPQPNDGRRDRQQSPCENNDGQALILPCPTLHVVRRSTGENDSGSKRSKEHRPDCHQHGMDAEPVLNIGSDPSLAQKPALLFENDNNR